MGGSVVLYDCINVALCELLCVFMVWCSFMIAYRVGLWVLV